MYEIRRNKCCSKVVMSKVKRNEEVKGGFLEILCLNDMNCKNLF